MEFLNPNLNPNPNPKQTPQVALHIQITRVDPNSHEVDDLIRRLTSVIHKNPTRSFCPEISACIRTNNGKILSHIVNQTTIDCPEALFYEFITSDIYRSGKGFDIAIRWFGANTINPVNRFDVRRLSHHIPKILYPLYTRNNPNLKQTIFQIKISNTKVDDAYKFIRGILRVLHKSSLPFPKAILQWFVDELILAGPNAGLHPLSEVNNTTATIADLIMKYSEIIIIDTITDPHLSRNEESKYCLLIRDHPNFHERINRMLRTHGIYKDAETTVCYPETSATIETNHYPTEPVSASGYPEIHGPTQNTVLPIYITSTTHPNVTPPPRHSPFSAHTPTHAIPIEEAPYAVAEPEFLPNEFRVSDPDEPGIRLIRNKEQTEAERIYGGRRPSSLRRTKKNINRKQKRKTKLSRKTRSRNHR